MIVKRKIIQIDEELCDGCGQCVPACAEGTLEIIEGKAKVVADNLCDGLGACLGECPTGALTIIEREADEFDEEAVTERLTVIEAQQPKAPEKTMPCGCPSSHIMQFGETAAEQAPSTALQGTSESALSHWPVKIRLVPPNAPFLKGADLLVLADCVPAAHPDLHQTLLKGRAVMMGCPKFDEVQDYIDKFTQIFKAGQIKSITSVIMEVPCCTGLHVIVRKALEASGNDIPLEEVIIGRRGEILETNRVA